MLIKLRNISKGYATVSDERGREIGEVYFADEITDERGRTVHAAGWVPVPLGKVSHANLPQFPRSLSRAGAAWMLASGDLIQ